MVSKKVYSRRSTLHLTHLKGYVVIESDKWNHTIISDVGSIIRTSIRNFYSISETKSLKLKKLVK